MATDQGTAMAADRALDAVALAPGTPLPPTTRRKRRRRDFERFRTRNAVILLFMAVVAGYFVLPIYWLFVASSKSVGDLFTTSGLAFGDWNLWTNLREVYARDDGIILRWMANSFLYAGIGSAVSTLLCALAGYALAKYSFRGRNAAFAVVIGAILVPGAALALPVYLLVSKMGIINTYWAVLLPSLVNPFGVYLCRVYASSAVPDELVDAARLDGAGELRIIGTIGLRLLSPALATIFLLSVVGAWNNFFLPLVVLSDKDLFPITVGLVLWNQAPELSGGEVAYNHILTGSLVSVIPLIFVFLLLQRFWRNGLLLGSGVS
jgi:multiple sugar transport system permease protein